jgi:hypothetical protein
MTPRLCSPEQRGCIEASQARELPIVVPVVEITEVDNAGGETILDAFKHILLQFDLRARY